MDKQRIRYYQLAKQNLLQPVAQNEHPDVLKKHIALHSTEYQTPYLSLWPRVKNFEPAELFRNLNDNRSAIRIRAFRGTLFVIHRDNLSDVLGCAHYFHGSRRREIDRFAEKNEYDFPALLDKLVPYFANGEQLTTADIKKALNNELKSDHLTAFMRYLEFNYFIVRTTQRNISDRVIRHGLLCDWEPDIDTAEIDPEQSLENMMLKYIRKFGPVCLEDICWWFPLTKTVGRQFLERLSDRLTHIEFNNRDYVMENEDFRRLQQFRPPTDKPLIHFLPYEDHFGKAFFVRDWFLSDDTIPLIQFTGQIHLGQHRPTIWYNGQIIGRWETDWTEAKKSELKVEIAAVHDDHKAVIPQIEKRRIKLEQFINEKLLPLMRA